VVKHPRAYRVVQVGTDSYHSIASAMPNTCAKEWRVSPAARSVRRSHRLLQKLEDGAVGISAVGAVASLCNSEEIAGRIQH